MAIEHAGGLHTTASSISSCVSEIAWVLDRPIMHDNSNAQDQLEW